MEKNLPEKRMLRFIGKHHLLTLATLNQGKPWTCSCFYVYREEHNLFVFTSDMETIHSRNMLEQEWVAGNIALETKIIGKIQGIQFTGRVRILEDRELHTARTAYIKRFPVAAIMETTLWGLEPEMMKMTDNLLGFGKKLYWHKGSENG